MIIATIIVGVVGLYLSFILLKNGWLRTILSAVFGILLVGSLYLVNANDQSHFGMHAVTTSTTKPIYSASPDQQLPMLLYKDIGTASNHKVYIYRLAPDAKQVHTKADYLIRNVVKSGPKATIESKRTEWVYRNDFYRVFFAHQNDHHLIKQTNTITVPNTWLRLTTAQAQALGKRLKASQTPEAAAKVAATVQQAVAAAKKVDPRLSAEQQQQIADQTKAKLQQAAIQEALKMIRE